MDKVMIQGVSQGFPFEGWTADHYDLYLGRNEHEGFQVVVMPTTRLSSATVTVSTLTNVSNGAPLAGSVQVSLVGYVDVADDPYNPIRYPDYLTNYHGWWPDPILTFTHSCNINANDRVPFWVDVAARTNAVPGDYTATITVTASGIAPITRQLNLHVWDIELPFRPRLQTAFSCEMNASDGAKGIYGSSWGSVLRYAYYDMLLSHRMSPTELYRTANPVPQEWIDYWYADGTSAFGLGKVPGIATADLAPIVTYLRNAGMLDFAYVYGYDEVTSQVDFDKICNKFGEIHNTYPGLRTMTTARDYSFGTSATTACLRVVVDMWCAPTPYYDVAKGESLRSEGRELWWYNTAFPSYPWANWPIEYPAIETRLLMGAMAFKHKTDGHLYWRIDCYANNSAPISASSGPYTSWDPRSLLHSSGKWADGVGALVLPGPTGPIPTLRLENIRDGLEDYDYLVLLRDLAAEIRALPSTPAREAFLVEADTLLAVPASVVDTMTSFTRTPVTLYDYRQQVANAILGGRALLAPTLSYTVANGDITLSWATNYLGWSLQAQTNAAGGGLSTNWVAVPGSTTNTSMTFPLGADNPPVFYRLSRLP